MNIPRINISEYIRCARCKSELSPNSKVYYSKYCLHKLCDTCYRAHFSANKQYKCTLCGEKGHTHDTNDFFFEPQDRRYYDRDIKLRQFILASAFYRKEESFPTTEDYDNYLEQIEDLIEKKVEDQTKAETMDINEQELRKEFQNCGIEMQPKEQLDLNLQKRQNEIDNLRRQNARRDPKRIYNSKHTVEEEDIVPDLKDVDMVDTVPTINMNINTNVRLPIYREGGRFKIEKDVNKEILAGGYNNELIYRDCIFYAKGGLI